MPSGWNDKVSSLEVYRAANGLPAVGKWTGITTTEQISFTYHIGFKTEKSTEHTQSEKYTLGYELTTGIEFEHETVSSSFT